MKKSLSTALMLACLLPGAGLADDLTWTNSGTGNWVVPGNWDPEPPAGPTASDRAQIDLGTAAVDTGAEASEVLVQQTGRLVVLDGGALVVGSSVTFNNGGAATVAGAGSSISTPQLVVGVTGTSSLTIASGASVSVGSGTMTVGQNEGAVAALNIGSADLFSPTTAGTLNADAVVLNSSLGSINFNHTGSLTFSADITGAGRVVKRGSGTTTLTGNSSYTGGTVIESGTLIVDGFIGDVEVQAGTTLQGDGDVNDIDLQSGSKIVPIDCFDGNTLSWHTDATMEFGLGGGGGANILELQNLEKMPSIEGVYSFTFTDAGWEIGEEYLLVVFNETNFVLEDFSFTIGGGLTGYFTMDESTLRFTLVPEPSVWALAAAGLGALGLMRRRRG